MPQSNFFPTTNLAKFKNF